MAYYTSSVNELRQKESQLKHRLEKIYEDKLDEKITQEFYNRKSKEWTGEFEKIEELIQKHNNANNKYRQLGISIYELSQRAKKIFLKAENEEDKRSLINLVFSHLTLDEGNLNIEYSKTFKLLAEAIRFTNSSKMPKRVKTKEDNFEPKEQIDITTQKGFFYQNVQSGSPA